MRFRAGDDLLDRIRASLLRRDHRGDRGDGVRRGSGGWQKPVAPPPQESRPAGLPSRAIHFGRLGEMGHPDDRADDWPGAGTGT